MPVEEEDSKNGSHPQLKHTTANSNTHYENTSWQLREGCGR